MNMTLEVTDKNLEEVLTNEITVLDFWAAWCGPCRTLGPIIDELAKDNTSDESLAIGKVNVDQNPKTAATYGIRSIPYVIFFKNGEEVDKLVGVQPKDVYQSKIDSLK